MDRPKMNRATRFLIISMICIVLLCILVFSALGTYMNNESSSTIRRVGNLYMTGLKEQIVMHFESLVGFRLDQVTAIVETASPGSMPEDELKEEIVYRANIRGFDYLAYYSWEGEFEMLNGSMLQVIDPAPFLESLRNEEIKIAVGIDEENNKLVLFGIPGKYQMSDGKESMALVAALPVEVISDTLALGESDALVFSNILRQDGSYVVRGSGMERLNYFDSIREEYGELDKEASENYISGLEKAMEDRAEYLEEVNIGNVRWKISGIALPYSEWYLVTIMPFGQLDEAINHMGHRQLLLTMAACGIIMIALAIVFFKYLRLTKQQISDLEAARNEAVRATRAKSEFLSNMSHDIRTPMNAIVGMTAIAIANFENQDQVRHCLKKITLSSKHLLGLINDVLDMSKIESGKMTLNVDQISLREIMDNIVGIVQPQVRAKRQNFDVRIFDVIAENVCCDSVRLNQVLLNFLSNAIKFTPEEGTIQLSLYEEESAKGPDYVRTHIEVKDNGIGMSQDFLHKVFESYAREDNARVSKTEGSGLGMAITKYIVDAMGGTIDVKSEPGAGTEFHVILDLEKADVSDVEMVLPDWRMLVVDDDELLCQSTVESLKSIGIVADWAMSGEDAVRKVEEHHNRDMDYQIILLDWRLPGMDGIETARAIRQHLGDEMPILLISAYDWGEIEERARKAGITGFISKPLFRSTLYYGLRKYMDAEEKQEDSAEQEINLAGKHILVAEDNELNWEIAEELLSELGLELDWADNGKVCVEKFEQSETGYYDAVLMDLRMPYMSGYEATEAIRKSERSDSQIPIIAMTADAFTEDIEKCLECGMNAHVAKPIDVKEIARLLEKYTR